MSVFDAIGQRVAIRRATVDDCDEFIALTRASRDFHRPWGEWPATREAFYDHLRRRQSETDDGFLVCQREPGRIVGGINLNCIVRRAFQSAYLGYWVGAEHARQGYMTEGMRLVTRYAFTEISLHRLEANIQPGNAASIALVRRCGFRREGFSPKYLKVLGQWCDHERWALLAEDLPNAG